MYRITSVKRIKLGPLEFTEREWADLFQRALNQHNSGSSEHPAVTWINEFLNMAAQQGFELRPSSTLEQVRSVWRN